MKYDRTAAFKSDYRDLSHEEKEMFRRAVVEINAAYARRRSGGKIQWPAKLRVKRIRGTAGIWEMTWSFAGPDGRATFEIRQEGDHPVLLWRRVGGHEIFAGP